MFKNYMSPRSVIWLGFDKFHKVLYAIDLGQSTTTITLTLSKCMPFLWEKFADCKTVVLEGIEVSQIYFGLSESNKFIGVLIFDRRLNQNYDYLWVINVETGTIKKSLLDRNIIGGGLMDRPEYQFDHTGLIGGDEVALLQGASLGWIATKAEFVGKHGSLKNMVIYHVLPTGSKLFQWRKMTMVPKNHEYRCVLSVGDTVCCLLERFQGWDIYNFITGTWSEIRCYCTLNPWHYPSEWYAVLIDDDFYIINNPFDTAEKILKINRKRKLVERTQYQFLVALWDWAVITPFVSRWEVAGASGLIVTPASASSEGAEEWCGGILRIKLSTLQDLAFECIMLTCPVNFDDLQYVKCIGVSEILTRIYFGPDWTLK